MQFRNHKLDVNSTTEASDLISNFTGREWVFQTIYLWLSDPTGSRYFLLTGEPGAGKTAISDRLTQFSQSANPLNPDLLPDFLNAIHRCSARNSTSIDPKTFARVIALQLAQHIPSFAQALKDIGEKQVNIQINQSVGTANDSTIQAVVVHNLDLSGVMTAQEAFNWVVLNPLHTIYQAGFDQPIIILVDALDEALIHQGDRTIVDFLANLESLPPQVRFIVTSRKVPQVENKFLNAEELNLSAPEFDIHNQADIRAYIQTRIFQTPPLSTHLSNLESQLQESAIDQITQKSDGNFLYVRFLLDAIERGERSLTNLEGLPEGLDGLYYESLERVVNLGRQDWRTTYAPIIGVLSVARTSLTFTQLQAFTQQSESTLWQCLGDLRQFLEELEPQSPSTAESSYRLYHQSVVDFLRVRSLKLGNNTRHNLYYLPPQEFHQRIVHSYQQVGHPLHEISFDDAYFWYYFPYHLSETVQQDVLRALLSNFDWIKAKLDATNVTALLLDYGFVSNISNLCLVKSAIQLSAHILAQDKTQLAGQMLGRLMSYNDRDIQIMLKQAKNWNAVPWLRPLTPSLNSPNEPLIRTLRGHIGNINAVALTPNGQFVVSASGGPQLSSENVVKVWDFESGVERFTLVGHEQKINAVTVATMLNGQHIFTASDDTTIRIWDFENARQICVLTGHAKRVNAVIVMPEEQKVISASDDNTLKIWNIGKDEEPLTLRGHTAPVTALAQMPDGKHVISGSKDKTIRMWCLDTGAEVICLHNGVTEVTTLAVTPDGTCLISNINESSLRVWSLECREGIRHLNGHVFAVTGVTMTADGRYAISTSKDKSVKIWDLQNWTNVQTLHGHTACVSSIALTPDGKMAISASHDATLKIWDLEKRIETCLVKEHENRVADLAITTDGKQAISASWDRTLKLWDLATGAELQSFIGHHMPVHAVALLPDQKRAISGSQDRTLKLWNLEQQRELTTLSGHTLDIVAVAVAPDGKHAISTSNYRFTGMLSADKPLRYWDLEASQEINLPENLNTYINGLLESHEGIYSPRTASGGHPTGQISALTILLEGKCLMAIDSFDNPIILIASFRENIAIETLQVHSYPVTSLAVTADGQTALSASMWECSLKVWDVESRQENCTLLGHIDWINSVAITPDGRYAVSASKDATVKLWDLASKTAVATFSADSAITSCSIAPDGTAIVAGEEHGRIHFLQFHDTGESSM